jgi:hypothetical protein
MRPEYTIATTPPRDYFDLFFVVLFLVGALLPLIHSIASTAVTSIKSRIRKKKGYL